MDKPSRSSADRRQAIAVYKGIFEAVLDARPSGMRNRLAEALGKNRSFVSHITNPAYDTPIPSGHIKTIFELCHFSADERRQFLEAYDEAHPANRSRQPRIEKSRQVAIRLPDFGDDDLNRKVDRLMQSLSNEIANTFAKERRRKPTGKGS